MFDSSPDGQPPSQPSPSFVRHSSTEPDAVRDTNFFARVLESTLAQTSEADPTERAELEALRKTLQPHLGQEFALQPVTVAIVQAILGSEFPDQFNRPNQWEPMCERIAQTLYDDPVARDRLQALWTRITGS